MPVANAVFEGGGVKGIGLVGALTVLEEHGYIWRRVAGTSAGAIVAGLVAAGYSGAEITTILKTEVDYTRFMQRDWARWIPLPLAATVRILRRQGVYSGDYAVELIERLLKRKLGKDGATFRDLSIACRMIASDITNRRLVVLPDDLAQYGIADPLGFPVAQAVRASMSIPIFFEPCILPTGGGPAKTVTLVDGGLLSNFPVWLFDPHDAPPTEPTIGFFLQPPGAAGPWPTNTLPGFLHALVATALEGHDDYNLTHQDYERTIAINTGDIKTTDFHLSAAKRDWLYASGRQAGLQFLRGFDFAAWLERFSPRSVRRRAAE